MIASANPSDLSTALIAIGSSVAGGLIAGGFSLLAVRTSYKNERKLRSRDRSDDAAQTVLDAIVELDKAVANWIGTPNSLELAKVASDHYNDFARDLAAQGFKINDKVLRDRLDTHMQLCHQVLRVIAAKGGPRSGVGIALLEALRAHCIANVQSNCRAFPSRTAP